MAINEIEINNIIEFPPKLDNILYWKERYIDLEGGRGSGKSWSLGLALLCFAIQNKERILCTREIQKTIRDSVHKLLSDTISRMGWDMMFDIKNDSIKSLNGSEFIFKGLHNNAEGIKSTEGITKCWVEEAHRASRQSLDILIPTVREKGSLIYFSYNPTNEDDPVHVDYTLSNREDVRHVQMNYVDNPWFPDVLKSEMEWDRAHDLDKYYHIWEGQCVKHSQSQIFYGKWVIEDFLTPEDSFFLFGADWGFSTDPTTLIRCFEKDKKLYIDQEFWGLGVELEQIAQNFIRIEFSNKYLIKADSSRPDTISYLQRHGFPLMRPAIKGKNSIEDGIEFLKNYEKIIVNPRCIHTIDEFKTYCYKIDPLTNAITRIILDKNNHLMDSLRYAVEDRMRLHAENRIRII